MKKYLAVLLIAIMAISVLSAAEVAVATPSTLSPAKPQQPTGIPDDPNPPVSNPPSWGSTVQVKLQVSPLSPPLPLVILPQTDQLIRVTILYQKNFDALSYEPLTHSDTFTFGRTGTEASPITKYASDVNGNQDLTLVFRAKDTGLRPGDFCGKLTGTIEKPGCWNAVPIHCDMVPPPGDLVSVTVTGTALVLVA